MNQDNQSKQDRIFTLLPWVMMAVLSALATWALNRFFAYAIPFLAGRGAYAFALYWEYHQFASFVPVGLLIIGGLALRFSWLRRPWVATAVGIVLSCGHLFLAQALLWSVPRLVGEPFPPQLKAERRTFIEQADRITLYSLWPVPEDHRSASQQKFEGELYGWPVLGKVEIESPKERSRVVQDLLTSIDENLGGEALCFEPRHALRLRRGSEEMELVICYHCGFLILHHGGATQHVALANSSKATLNSLLRKAGIKLAPEDVH